MGAPLVFTVPGCPVAKGRPKLTTVGGMARAYTPSKTRNYESLVRLAAEQAMAGLPPFDGPLRVNISVFLSIPESWSNKKKLAAQAGDVLPTKKPDLDNVVKAVMDGMNSVAFVDDSRVVSAFLLKRYSASPRVVVELSSEPGVAA